MAAALVEAPTAVLRDGPRSEAELAAAELVQLADAVDDEQPDPSLLSISPSSVPQSTEEHSNAVPETG